MCFPETLSNSSKKARVKLGNDVTIRPPDNCSALVMLCFTGACKDKEHLPKPSSSNSLMCASPDSKRVSRKMSCPVMPMSTLPSPT